MPWVFTINTYWAVWSPTLSQGGPLQKLKIFVGRQLGAKGEGTGGQQPPASGIATPMCRLRNDGRPFGSVLIHVELYKKLRQYFLIHH